MHLFLLISIKLGALYLIYKTVTSTTSTVSNQYQVTSCIPISLQLHLLLSINIKLGFIRVDKKKYLVIDKRCLHIILPLIYILCYI